jgi:hypothetical protein
MDHEPLLGKTSGAPGLAVEMHAARQDSECAYNRKIPAAGEIGQNMWANV